jgi:hypothetical protein
MTMLTKDELRDAGFPDKIPIRGRVDFVLDGEGTLRTVIYPATTARDIQEAGVGLAAQVRIVQHFEVAALEGCDFWRLACPLTV